jgi:hypothetical protein
MRETRRKFVVSLATAVSGLIAAQELLRAQNPPERQRPGFPDPPMPADPRQQDKNAGPLDPKTVQKAILKQNEKEFRAGVEKLYQMAGELKDEMDKTSTTDVLSVHMYKKMEEIEKLAKQLKSKAKG